jgi:general secretion pathway protein I
MGNCAWEMCRRNCESAKLSESAKRQQRFAVTSRPALLFLSDFALSLHFALSQFPSRSSPVRRVGKSRSGFTLVEVLVAAVVLAVGISAGVRTLGAMTQASAAAADRETAVRLAGERLALIEGVEGVSGGNTQGQFEYEPRFHWQQQVSSAANVTGVLEVTVTILWQEGRATRRYAVSTYLLDPALLQQNQSSSGGAA